MGYCTAIDLSDEEVARRINGQLFIMPMKYSSAFLLVVRRRGRVQRSLGVCTPDGLNAAPHIMNATSRLKETLKIIARMIFKNSRCLLLLIKKINIICSKYGYLSCHILPF